MHNLCLITKKKIDQIKRNDKRIDFKENPFRNIVKAYTRMYKAYSDVSEITNTEDLRRYGRQCDRLLDLQKAFIDIQQSPSVQEVDNSLKRETSIDKIKLVVGLE